MYNQFQNPQNIPMYPYTQQTFGQPKIDIIRVNGENGARAYQMPPNSNTLLLDESNPIVWLAQTDGAGYKTITPYTITPYKPEPSVDVKSLEDRIARLEELINVKSNAANVEQSSDATARKLKEHKTDDVYY